MHRVCVCVRACVCVCVCVCCCFSPARLFSTLWTVARQAPMTMGFSRQEYQSELSFPSPGDLPDPRIEPCISCIDREVLYHQHNLGNTHCVCVCVCVCVVSLLSVVLVVSLFSHFKQLCDKTSLYLNICLTNECFSWKGFPDTEQLSPRCLLFANPFLFDSNITRFSAIDHLRIVVILLLLLL